MRLLNTAAWRSASIALAVLLNMGVRGATAQQARAGEPQFLIASADRRVPARTEPSRIPFLGTRVKLAAKDMPLTQVLAAIGRQAGVAFVYGPDIIPSGRLVSVRADNLTLAAVLTEVLFGTGVDVLISGRRQLTLVPGPGMVKAPTGSVFGRVTDAMTGRGIEAADILLEGTRWRTTTDTAGQFSLAGVDSGQYHLLARRLGYLKQSRAIVVQDGRTDTVNVALEAAAARLDELVTTATGQQRRRDVPNDITTINADSVMRVAPVNSVTELLENRVPGLTTQRTSGAPGDPARIRLRGAGSPLQNNDPIVVVDGIRYAARQSDARSANLANSNFAAPSPLDYIDPNSIETIEVVKGPSAAALYGPDAANGVIVITTKRGKAGPTRWTLSADHGRTQIPGHYPDLFFRWGHEPFGGGNVYCPLVSPHVPAVPVCIPDSIVSFQMLNDPATTVLDKGHTTDFSLGASGGTSALTYSITGSYRDELGLLKLPDYEATRYLSIEGQGAPDWMRRPQRLKYWSATSNIGARLGAAAQVTLTSMLSRTTQQRSPLEQQLRDIMSTFFDRGNGIYYNSLLIDATNVGEGSYSTYFISQYRTQVTDVATQLTNSVNMSWPARSWLNVNATAGLNLEHRTSETFLPLSRDSTYREGITPTTVGGVSSPGGSATGAVNLGTGMLITSTANVGAVAIAPLGHGFKFRVASGLSYISNSTQDLTLLTTQLPYGIGRNDLGGFVNGKTRNALDNSTFGWSLAPELVHPRFAINLGLQMTGGSAYGSKVSGFKLPSFPKLGFSYLLSDEPWFPFKDLFQSFRARFAYGRAGIQPGPADRLRLYSSIGSTPGIGDYETLLTLGNTELRPERRTEIESGFDAVLLDSRVSVLFSVYRKTTNDALLPTPLAPSIYGLGASTLRNIGVVRNTGLSLDVSAQLVRSHLITWSTQVQLAQNRNMVVRLGPGVLPFYTDGISTGSTGAPFGADFFNDFVRTRVAAGYPLFSRWVRPVIGYADVNGDGLLQYSEVRFGDTAVYVGKQEPDYTLSVFPQVSLWNGALTLTAGITHEGGVSQMNQAAQDFAPFTRGSNDPTTSLAEQLTTGKMADWIPFELIQTTATTRFQELSVSYRVPPNVARRLGAQSLSIAVQGQNLGIWTNYRGLDPNVNSFSTGNSVTDNGVLPTPRTWQVKINATY